MRHNWYNTDRYPFYVTTYDNWDIWTDKDGECASIPTPEALKQGCKASAFGDRSRVIQKFGIDPLESVDKVVDVDELRKQNLIAYHSR